MPTDKAHMHALLEKASSLPLCPGVYIMRSKSGKVIYVGKSKKLRNRVSQYFQNGAQNVKTEKMVSAVSDFDYFVCDTEIEALSLENTLIKQYSPRYNIRLKDDKSYPYIKISADEYPSIVCTRKRDNDKGKYFGPYTGISTAYAIIGLLQKTLGLPSCKRQFPRDIGKERPCLYYQMGQCCGLCTGNVDADEYAALIKCATDILRGNTSAAKQKLKEQMLEYSENERYEAAAKCRDTMIALDKLRQKQKVVASPDTEQDVIGLYNGDISSAVTVFYIREGTLNDKAEFVFGADEIADEGAMTSFICEHYRRREYIPSKILLSFTPPEDELELITSFLCDQAKRKISLRIPERGELKTLCDMAVENAKEKARVYEQDTQKNDKTLYRLAELLGLDILPERIESYDISNIGSENLTAGMIVCENGKFKKADYRVFSIKSVDGTDDYASMREALLRRFSHLSDERGSFAECPDLILLDGGKGHVSTVKQALSEIGVSVPVFGMVKDDFHKTRTLCDESSEISIANEKDVFTLVYRIQEEVHRFTVSRMHGAKRNTLKHSSLEKIKGIGTEKAKLLLARFGGLAGVKKATPEELALVKGITKRDSAEIYGYFHKNSDES